MKEKLYNSIAYSGIWFLSKFFPEYFAKEPLRPTDRFIEYPWVISNLPTPPATVLDIGCSGSIFPLILQAFGYDTYGIDIRDYKPDPTFNFHKADICNNNYKENQFDVITAISSIEHIGLEVYGSKEDPYRDVAAINQIYRILKPNGVLLMTVPVSKKFKKTLNHRIYDFYSLKDLMKYFLYSYKIVKSPEADYDIALIKAVK